MKRLLFSLVVLFAAAASGQVAQSGTPARLEVVNGKVVKAFLQSMEDGILTFQQSKSTRNVPAPADKIRSLTFYPKYDSVAVEHSFNEGDYSSVITTLGPVMEPYWDYMAISNNLQAAFGMLVKSHLREEDYAKVQSASEVLVESSNPDLVVQGQVYAALVALSNTTTNGVVASNSLVRAEALLGEVDSEVAGLYLQACIERAKGAPQEASKIVAELIANHGNDLDWMPQSELLSAYLYLDQGITNSAANCARQVQSIYGGSNIARDAEKFRATLPVEDPSTVEQPAKTAETEEAAEPAGAEENMGQDGMQEE